MAEDERLSRPVAIKLLLSKYADDEKLLERLRREVRAVTKLNSPFIVQVYGAKLTLKACPKARGIRVILLIRGQRLVPRHEGFA